MTRSEHPIVWQTHAGQRLGLVPSLGGGVAASDMYSLASFAIVPWSNRISGCGFENDG